jgi:thiamine biosynthesis lipoprotein
MSTAISVLGSGIDDGVADAFFARIGELEGVLSRFRPDSDVSRFSRGERTIDDVDPAVRVVLRECERLRALTRGDFEFEPRRRSGDPSDPVLDMNALAKGWIVEEAATALGMSAAEYLVNAGGDVTARARPNGEPWRVGIQHPVQRDAVIGTFDVTRGAVATSGAYERGEHIRSAGPIPLLSVTVVGPDLGLADALSTAVYASGQSPPRWWSDVDATYGLLTMASDNGLRWLPPATGTDIVWRFPSDTSVTESNAS